jgi:isocitrate dehydrogenase (NAD+)
MKTITLVPGDGIGPEIANSLQVIFDASKASIQWETVEAGLSAFEKTGTLIPKSFIESFDRTKIAIKGPTTTPVGSGHRSINVAMRQKFQLFANVRPIKNFVGLPCKYTDVDMIIVRENSEDLYKGIEYQVSDGVAQGIKLITREASEKISRHAFELAVKFKRKKVTTVHKANIMKFTDGLFLESVTNIAKKFPQIQFEDLIVDNMCMQMVTDPSQFDVIVTENLYGDILSDLGAGLVGGLGLISGGNFGTDRCIFEAAHGSAPDIAGQNKANPTALLLSGCMMLEYIGETLAANEIREAINKTLENPATRTGDLGGSTTTEGFTVAVLEHLKAP